MTDPANLATRELDGLDPYERQDRESDRISSFLGELDDDGWSAPTGCAEWTRRDLVAHLAATEGYHRAGLDDTLGALFERLLAAGAHDLHSFNDVGVRERSDRSAGEVLEEWRASNRATRAGFRDRGDGSMATSVGPYPARWQAFHVASELATHADDLGVPVTDDERDDRTAWRVRVSRFALGEAKGDLSVERSDGGTRVVGQGIDVEVPDEDLVVAVSGRLPADSQLDPATRAVLSTMP